MVYYTTKGRGRGQWIAVKWDLAKKASGVPILPGEEIIPAAGEDPKGDKTLDLSDPDAEGYDEDELTEEEKQERKKNRIQLLFGAGNLMGIIAGTVVILLLLAFLFQMINFVRDDIYEFFDTIRRFFM